MSHVKNGVEVEVNIFITSALAGSDSFTLLPFYPPSPRKKSNGRWVDYGVALGVAAKRKISLLPGIESRLSIPWSVTLTEQSSQLQ